MITVRYLDQYGNPTEKHFDDCEIRVSNGALEIVQVCEVGSDFTGYCEECSVIAAFSNWIWAHKEDVG